MLERNPKTSFRWDPLNQIKLHPLMNTSSGSPNVVIGLIDGPVDLTHPAFQDSRIRTAIDSQIIACKAADSAACTHGTFVAGILCAKRGLPAPAICPDCQLILCPIFTNDSKIKGTIFPSSTPEELSKAIIQTVNAGARIINLSVGLSASSLTSYHELEEAYNYAKQRDVIIVTASGNQGRIGHNPLINHPWIIPVVACDEQGRPTSESNLGPSMRNRGLMAPGVNITSASPGRRYTSMSGTSVAAPFVSGAIALLWSEFPNATAAEIKHSIIIAAAAKHHHSIIPPLLNAEKALQILKTLKNA